jgi:hypothetical protein
MTKPSSPAWVVKDILTTWKYFNGQDPAIPYLWVKGSVPLFLVLGENAGGKSFFRRCVRQLTRHETSIEEVIHISMEGRAGPNNDFGALKSFVYGDEVWQSTGENSAVTVETAIRTCQGRENSHLLYWDEPDIGMSDGAAAGLGIVLAQFVDKLPEHTKGVFVTTHNRVMVEQLLRLQPHYIHLGCAADQAPPTLEAWIKRPVVPILPSALADASRVRFSAIQKILNARKRVQS